jgi:hypothetical protein
MAAMAATISSVMKAAPMFALDRLQRAHRNKSESPRVTHFAKHLYSEVLPGFSGHFGVEYQGGLSEE